MNRTLEYTITSNEAGMTISQFLKKKGYSNPILVTLKKTHRAILLNQEWAYVNQKVQKDDTLTISLLENASSENIPPTKIADEDFHNMIVYEDEDILLLNKPANLPVHPSMGHHEDTLANYCAYYFRTKGSFVFRCVNRLDRDTSGLVLIAKNMLSSAILSASQLDHKIHRTYLAIAAGETQPFGTITLPIARKADSVIERCIDLDRGEHAVTHYQTLETKKTADGQLFSLLKIQLETGRTHQIRVHMKAIEHPLPGDFLYNPDFTYINRQALHSYRLEFIHPITGKSCSFEATPPDDFYFLPWETDTK